MSTEARVVLFAWVAMSQAQATSTPPPQMRPAARLARWSPPPPGRSTRGSGLIGWRALGANNRELGRSMHPSADVTSALEAVEWVRGGIGRAVTKTLREAGLGCSWRIMIDGEAAAVSSRRYQRQRECAYSLEQFLEWFPSAVIMPPPPALLRTSDAGRRRTVPLARPVVVLPQTVQSVKNCEAL